MGIDHTIMIDSEAFKNQTGIKIAYSDQTIANDALHIQPASLLFENEIKEQQLDFFEANGNKAFYKNESSAFPFDIFAASFFLLSRYEEYLPHTKDSYGRYAHENSIAFKEEFLNIPLINAWVDDLAKTIIEKFPSATIQRSTFSIVPTYDIDIAYSYKHKGFLRNTGGIIRSLITGKFAAAAARIKVLANKSTDPFDSFQKLDALHKRYQLDPIYFFLVPEKNGLYDKNILPHKEAMWQLVKKHAAKYRIGLHPSWQSGDDKNLLKKEKDQLEAMAEKEISTVRYHYLRFNLPGDYRRLSAAGFTDDHSMGYASINGFRASVASSFYWYDLQEEKQTSLRVHPFCFMEANAFYEEKLNTKETFDEMMHYYNACKKYNGNFISLWHNHFLGTDTLYTGLPELYERFFSIVCKSQAAEHDRRKVL